MKSTKEEVNLCKQVAEKHRKPIGYGDWFLDPNVMEKYQARLCTYIGERKFEEAYRSFTPLWTISDCLEFLVKKNYRIQSMWQWSNSEWEEGSIIGTTIRLEAFREGFKSKKAIEKYGNTLLEACLKAVLAVLEGEK